ncbi:MAG: PDZ domain-containing protein, partial [Pseudomonadota bacterium]|nr:PDZ domain-containing protein [Pseudomonadota bacterium]
DVAGLVKTARVLQETVEYLAGRPEALHSTIGGRQQIAAPPAGEGKRRVSLGTVPEYAFSGEGVQIAAVRAGTPAAQAGLQPGDVIIAVNKNPVHNLREYAQALKALNPGDEILIGYRRNGTEHRVRTHVVVR